MVMGPMWWTVVSVTAVLGWGTAAVLATTWVRTRKRRRVIEARLRGAGRIGNRI